MRIDRLAQLLEYKYNLKAVAATDKERVDAVRQALLDAYNHYVNISSRDLKPAYNILPLLAEQGERFSRQIIALMEDLINDIDTADLYALFDKVQSILAVIDELQSGKKQELRDSLHEMFPLRRETDRNRREMAKSKFENVVFKKLASILKKQAQALNIMLGKNMPTVGGPTEPEVREPTKQEQFMFRQTPMAVHNGLDNPEVFAQVWGLQDLKRRLIRLINKGKNRWAELERDPEIVLEVGAIMAEYRRRKTNEGLFNAPEEQAQQMLNRLPPEEEWSRQMQQYKQERALEQEEEQGVYSPEQVEELAKKRDEETKKRLEEEKQRQIEEDRERLIRSEGKMDVLLVRFSKRYL